MIRRADDLLQRFLEQYKLTREQAGFIDLIRGWEEEAGAELAAHTRVSDLEDGILIIETEHPGWIQLFKLQEEGILKKIRQDHPELKIKGIKMFVSQKTP
jgi:predicted nucleic acid-binding Zn ribbon protein